MVYTLPRGLICSGLAEFALRVSPLVPVVYLRRPLFPLLPRGARCPHVHWVQAGGHLRLPLVCRWLSVYSSRRSGCSRPPDPRPSRWLLYHRGGGGVSAFIDDTGLFFDGRIADLVATDTINIFTANGIFLCIDNCRFLVPPVPFFLPGGLPPSPLITTVPLSSDALPEPFNIVSERLPPSPPKPPDPSRPSSAYPADPLFPSSVNASPPGSATNLASVSDLEANLHSRLPRL